jgi:hypothetical protein
MISWPPILKDCLSLQGEHLLAEVFTEPPRKILLLVVYSGGC